MPTSSFFTEVLLKLPTGELVQSVKVPKFNEPPEVLIWGLRVFKRVGEEYHEVFYYAVPTR